MNSKVSFHSKTQKTPWAASSVSLPEENDVEKVLLDDKDVNAHSRLHGRTTNDFGKCDVRDANNRTPSNVL